MSKQIAKTYVLNGLTANDVAKGIISGGHQTEAFFIQDLDDAYRRIEYFKRKMPRVQIFYAIKSNDNVPLLKLVAALGLGFDCATPGEIYKVLKLQVDPRSIIFASPLKPPQWMTYAKKSGLLYSTFDSSFELKKIKQYWPDARLLIRIKVDSNSVYRLGDKFGCDYETEAIDLLDEAASLGIKVIGVAFHVGSVCFSFDSYVNGLRMAKALFDFEAKSGRHMSVVDIGGGFLSEKNTDIDEVSSLINIALEEHFPDKTVQIIAEPGRYISDSSMVLYTSINAVRWVEKNGEKINILYISDGKYGSLQYTEKWQTVSKLERNTDENHEDLYETIIWGNSLDSADRVLPDIKVYLPQCTPQDWLVFPIRGAYSYVFGSMFASVQLPQIRPVISMELWKKIRGSDVFDPEDIIENPDITEPMPSNLPKVINIQIHLKSNVLINA
ncbi:ornithine decarboxylase 1-like [Zerene cesonia]|uniref:ornithine decarboxylase 1-like n=1 Tax=Zerene cesonia TaxID=33412 RepID=UPI0018E56555|nr:ornithine decarboxylase 1-like [Zerene cesonia]